MVKKTKDKEEPEKTVTPAPNPYDPIEENTGSKIYNRIDGDRYFQITVPLIQVIQHVEREEKEGNILVGCLENPLKQPVLLFKKK